VKNFLRRLIGLLGQLNIHGKDKIQVAIDRIKEFEPEEGYYLGFSGGKDSVVIYDLANRSGVKFDAHHNLTTVGPPEQIYFIRNEYPEVEIERSETTMWKLIEKNGMPPTRIARYCCKDLKEHGGEGRFKILGLRWAESGKRKNNRRMIESCITMNTRTLNPIIDWSESEVWEYIELMNLKYCELYDQGYSRLGCIMCPQKGKKGMLKDAERYQKHYQAYLRAFDRMLKARKEKGLETSWNTAQEVMDWWINEQ
jgi:phosphoadenosine phosphosulfate reductase